MKAAASSLVVTEKLFRTGIVREGPGSHSRPLYGRDCAETTIPVDSAGEDCPVGRGRALSGKKILATVSIVITLGVLLAFVAPVIHASQVEPDFKKAAAPTKTSNLGESGTGLIASPDIDTDGDGIRDAVDEDDDNDGQLDRHEITCGSDPLDPKSFSADYDGDNLPDCFDLDDDNDGVAEC